MWKASLTRSTRSRCSGTGTLSTWSSTAGTFIRASLRCFPPWSPPSTGSFNRFSGATLGNASIRNRPLHAGYDQRCALGYRLFAFGVVWWNVSAGRTGGGFFVMASADFCHFFDVVFHRAQQPPARRYQCDYSRLRLRDAHLVRRRPAALALVSSSAGLFAAFTVVERVAGPGPFGGPWRRRWFTRRHKQTFYMHFIPSVVDCRRRVFRHQLDCPPQP